MPPILYLLDGHGLAYRAYFALTAGGTRSNAFQTNSGEPTAACMALPASSCVLSTETRITWQWF